MRHIDIDDLTEEELIDLNHRVVQRLRIMQEMRSHMSMLEYRIGESVEFDADGARVIAGVVARFNKKTVTVVSDTGQRWNVSPHLLRRREKNDGGTRGGGSNVIQLPKR